MEHETFWDLMKSLPHWEFELFLMLLFDGLVGSVAWPLIRKFGKHHQSDDQKIADLQRQLAEIKTHLGLK